MSIKSHLKKGAAAGAVLVALSGFVPEPLVNPLISQANAATATFNVTGSFITGIKLTPITDAKFGSVAATGVNGTAKLSTAGAVTSAKGTAVGGAQEGEVQFTAVNTTPNVDVTVKSMGAVVLAATSGGAGPTGTMKLTKLLFGDIAAATFAVTDAGGGTGVSAGVDIDTLAAVMKVGAHVSWGATQPLGQFTKQVKVYIAY